MSKKDPTKPKNKQSPAQLANLRPPWKPGQTGNPEHKNPRKPNRVIQLHKKLGVHKRNCGFTEEEIASIENFVLTATLGELQLIAKTDEVSAYEKTLAMAEILDMKNGRTTTIDKLRDRIFGMIKQIFDITSNGESLARGQGITQDEARALLASLEEKY